MTPNYSTNCESYTGTAAGTMAVSTSGDSDITTPGCGYTDDVCIVIEAAQLGVSPKVILVICTVPVAAVNHVEPLIKLIYLRAARVLNRGPPINYLFKNLFFVKLPSTA